MDYQIYDTITLNRFTPLIKKYTQTSTNIKGNYKQINNITDYKAWSYILKYYLNEIDDYNLSFLFNHLDPDELSYAYDFYINFSKEKSVFVPKINDNSPIIDFQLIYPNKSINELITIIKNELNNYNNKYLSINNETDYKAWSYLINYHNNIINSDQLDFLFSKLNLSELSYNYYNYKQGKSPILDFYDMLIIEDFMEEDEIKDKIDEAFLKIKNFEDQMNYIDDRSPAHLKNIILKITKAFLKKISSSLYVQTNGAASLEICPQSRSECTSDELSDPKNKCAVFTYGKYSFTEKDNRNYLEDDLT